MKKQLIISAALIFSASSLTSVHKLNAKETHPALNTDDCQLIVNEYLNTVTEFYGAASAFNDKMLYEQYPDFLEAIQNAGRESQKPEYAHLSNTIKTLYNQIQGAAENYQKDTNFTGLTKSGLERLQSQVDSIAHKVKAWKVSCKQEWQCYLGTEGTKCNKSTAQ
ncbi:hypothetical protein Bealeia1_00003 [Candidatus Bealeia paramacronuclearis]|uniref:Uncharacterized protein n=1 Tax=Candidatus Bealeia paramacronuclearis TaxID=1921001 RepID=A0ABZ2C309_9PROT|nr:hypothetical protein [Candidatus Bealeia paramacronuclearis]